MPVIRDVNTSRCPSRHDTCTRWGANGSTCVESIEDDAFRRHRIHMRCFQGWVSCESGIAIPLIVGHHQDDVWDCGLIGESCSYVNQLRNNCSGKQTCPYCHCVKKTMQSRPATFGLYHGKKMNHGESFNLHRVIGRLSLLGFDRSPFDNKNTNGARQLGGLVDARSRD